ncbi:MAG: rhomboid family intramembrane serine protease [Labilithrix sp.]|nr:rhomboid family intramembrane serine protease [Labilithrix sp.]
MLLPISHDKMSTRRIPVVTVVLILLTIALHGLATTYSGDEVELRRAIMDAQALYFQRPSLGVCPQLRGLQGDLEPIENPLGDIIERASTEEQKQEHAEKYATACARIDEAVSKIVPLRFGYVPARANLLGLFTYVFVHGDWWHVVGNMWFLFLCGLALEDRWGRLAFPVYYLVAGVVAAGVHHLAVSASSTAALVGASGAVAGAMGAFLVLFATTKIRFVGVLGFRFFTFRAPAFVMLPLWVAIEIVFGAALKHSSTAHWAHVGGFAFGAVVAGIFRLVGVDRKLDDAVERAAVLGNDPRVDTARALVAKGEGKAAIALLEGLAKEKPESIHVWEALRDAARQSGDLTRSGEASRQMETLEALRAGREPVAAPPRESRTSKASAAAPARRSSASVPAAKPTPLPSPDDGATPFFPAPPPRR